MKPEQPALRQPPVTLKSPSSNRRVLPRCHQAAKKSDDGRVPSLIKPQRNAVLKLSPLCL